MQAEMKGSMAQTIASAREGMDLESFERPLVGARMWLHYHLTPKGELLARKIFCLGPAKTGTSSLHAMFMANGLSSEHSAGNWHVSRFDAFSDRGDYRPYRAYARSFPNAVFVLNTRGLRSYLSSYASHLQRRLSPPDVPAIPVQFLVNRTLRRNHQMAEVLAFFAGTERLIVANIERPGSIGRIAAALGLKSPEEVHRHKTARQRIEGTEANIDQALALLGLTSRAEEPLIFPQFLPQDLARAAAAGVPAAERCLV